MADGSLGQDDIDKLLNDLGAAGPTPAAPTPSKPPTARVAAPTPAAPTPAAPTPAAPTPAAAGDMPLDQAAIDALVAQAADVVAEAPKPATASTASTGHLDQSEIDKLLAELDPQSRKSAAVSSASGHLDQKDIDRLLNELEVSGGGNASEVVPATVVPPAASAPSASATSSPAPAPAARAAPAPSASGAAPEGPLSQDDIDKMLSELGASTPSLGASKKTAAVQAPAQRVVPPAPAPVAAVLAKPADVTQALTPAEIDAIVAKQGAASPPGSESEAVIAQSDIDALVKQLAQATGSPEAQEVADAIAGKAADIDRIQAEAAASAGPELTRDAVDVNSVLGHTASTANLHLHAGAPATIATVATLEWKAARWLLAAAVLLLAICGGALITLTTTVSQLSGELRAAREVEHPKVDGYADKLRLALAKLGDSDEVERARGIRWMDELKEQYPDRAGEVGLALARHFRAREAWRRAADEYAAAAEAPGSADDPRVPLEHADCLTRLGDEAGAIRRVYALLAAEARWTAERDADGRAVTALAGNRQAISDAYLMLGRLLARDPPPVAATAPATAPAVEGQH